MKSFGTWALLGIALTACSGVDWEPAPVPGVMLPPPLDPYADPEADELMGDDDDDDDDAAPPPAPAEPEAPKPPAEAPTQPPAPEKAP